MILPNIKKFETDNGYVEIPERITFFAHDERSVVGTRVFSILAPTSTEQMGDGFVEFLFDSSLDENKEEYTLTLEEKKITVRFGGDRGAANGAATVALLLRKDKITTGTVTDRPDAEFRSFMIDMARGLPSLHMVKHHIKSMALAKYNRLHLHLMDSEGICFRSDVMPLVEGKNGEQYTKDQIREIIALCSDLCIEIIPEVEIPAHATALINAYPHFACDTDGTSNWTLCPAVDEVFTVFEDLIKEVAELFPGDYLHIGSDELEFPDLFPKYDMICYWDKCPRCAALREKHGMRDIRDQFYYVIERVYKMVVAAGKKMIMWNDQIDISRDVPLSRDILIEFWRVAAPTRGPVEGCSMNEFLNKGFTVINAHYPDTYVDLDEYLTPSNLKDWSPLTSPYVSPENRGSVIGGEMCAWEFGNTPEYPFYPYVTDLALALFGDKLWTYGSVSYDKEYKDALSEFLFGYTLENDIFECIGDVLPPRDAKKYSYIKDEERSPELIAACITELKSKKTEFNEYNTNAFITLLEKM